MALSNNEGDFNTAASNDYEIIKARQEAEISAIKLTDEEIKTACYKLQREKWYKSRGITVNAHGYIKTSDYWAKIEQIMETT
ncbi:MAG: hypothetical protein IM602_17290 [Cytophagales bacterium]|jgi:hypothetical protein|nr:hypothetical protein [Cytophagales bacterium]MCA6415653.1 hypothetical protein [Cytophagales bacterium]MCA6427401.1 hypothetical protein [Cytophagales bacterium]